MSLTEVAISLSAFTLLYGVLAVVEAKLLWRYVLAGPGHVMPYPDPETDTATGDPADPAENAEDRVPAFVY